MWMESVVECMFALSVFFTCFFLFYSFIYLIFLGVCMCERLSVCLLEINVRLIDMSSYSERWGHVHVDVIRLIMVLVILFLSN